MKVTDIIFAIISGRIIGYLVSGFLKDWGLAVGFYIQLILWVALPLFSLLCLWIAYLIGKRFLFVFQGAKYLLVGAVATVFDLKAFEFFNWGIALMVTASLLIPKGLSFLVATSFKYYGNKYWVFNKHEKEERGREVIQFFGITLVGMVINMIAFYYFTEILGTQFGIPQTAWLKFSVIFAAAAAVVWNFAGYKFFVFKR